MGVLLGTAAYEDECAIWL